MPALRASSVAIKNAVVDTTSTDPCGGAMSGPCQRRGERGDCMVMSMRRGVLGSAPVAITLGSARA